MIYLDNAATTLHKPPQVAQAVLDAMNRAGNSARGAHAGSLNAARLIYETRVKLAALLGCSRPDHVVFTANVTEALNMAICGMLQSGDHVITTDLEHNSVLRPLYRLQKESAVSLSFIPTDEHGNPIYEQMEGLLRENTKALICTHASNLTGNLVDLRKMSTFAKEHGILLIVDAAQTAGNVPINMNQMGIDVLCFTGHKGLMGPQGTGGLCLREGLKIRPLIVGGSGVQSHRHEQPEQLPTLLEAGTMNAHGIAGLSAAVDVIQSIGVEKIHEKELKLTGQFYTGIVGIPNIKIYGDYRSDRAAIVAMNIGERDSGEIADELYERYDIAVRAGVHCAPRMHDALGTHNQGAVRFSFSYYNTEDEVNAAIRAVAEVAAE